MSEFYQKLLHFLQEQLQKRILNHCHVKQQTKKNLQSIREERVVRDQETPEMSAHLPAL
jgi:hypothetical protein